MQSYKKNPEFLFFLNFFNTIERHIKKKTLKKSLLFQFKYPFFSFLLLIKINGNNKLIYKRIKKMINFEFKNQKI